MPGTLWRSLVPCILLLACRPSGPPASPEDGPLVARGEGVQISAKRFEARLAELTSTAPGYYGKPEHRREVLEELIRSELLAREATRRGLDQDPEVRAAAQRVLIQKLLKQESELPLAAISEPDLQQYYEAHRSAFEQGFEQARAQISSLLERERRTRQIEAFVQGLRDQAKIEVDEARLGAAPTRPK